MRIFNLKQHRHIRVSCLQQRRGFMVVPVLHASHPPASAVRFPSLPDMQQRSQTHTAEQSRHGCAYQSGRETDRQRVRSGGDEQRGGRSGTGRQRVRDEREEAPLVLPLHHSSFSPLQSACHPAQPSGLQLRSSYKGILLPRLSLLRKEGERRADAGSFRWLAVRSCSRASLLCQCWLLLKMEDIP